jgi:hypothetical protein
LGAKEYLHRKQPEYTLPVAFEKYTNHQFSISFEPGAIRAFEGQRQDSILYLCQQLKSSNDTLSRLAAIEALRELGAAEAEDALVGALNDEVKEIRIKAVQALGNLSSKRAVPALLKALESNDKHVQLPAVQALLKLNVTETIQALRKLLKSEEKEVQQVACIALGDLRARDAIPDLRSLLHNKNMQTVAAEALGKMNLLEAIPYLRKAEVLKERIYTVASFTQPLRRLFQFGKKLIANYGTDQDFSVIHAPDLYYPSYEVLQVLLSNTPVFQDEAEKRFYIRELRKLKRQNIERKLATERLEALDANSSLHQDPFMRLEKTRVQKAVRAILIYLAIIATFTILSLTMTLFGSAQDIFMAIYGKTLITWVTAYPTIALVVFISLGLITGLLPWIIDSLRENLTNK